MNFGDLVAVSDLVAASISYHTWPTVATDGPPQVHLWESTQVPLETQTKNTKHKDSERAKSGDSVIFWYRNEQLWHESQLPPQL